MRIPLALAVEALPRLNALPRWCGDKDSTGVHEMAEFQDYSRRPTTRDQTRIENVLLGRDLTGLDILHVGVGNSGLAAKFHSKCRTVDGITLGANELALAQSLGIANYRCRLLNKYDPRLARKLGTRYDLVIDNNPTTYCCCRWHATAMMTNYSRLLKPGGTIFTDERGLGWFSEPNDPRWGLTPDEWWVLGQHFGLGSVKFTDHVIGLVMPLPGAMESKDRVA